MTNRFFGGDSLRKNIKILYTLIMCISLILFKSISANAAVNRGIIIDGNFDDWIGKPFISDIKHDDKSTPADFLRLGYFTDKDYLYLNVTRLSAKKSEPWNFSVIMLNGVKGTMKEQRPFGKGNPVYAPQFDISTYFANDKSSNGALVTVNFDGENIENTFSASNDVKEIEFRVPLSKVGLNGQNKEIKFVLKSSSSQKNGDIDWVPYGRPIIVTTGPTFWQLSTIIVFTSVAFIVYKFYNRNMLLVKNKQKHRYS